MPYWTALYRHPNAISYHCILRRAIAYLCYRSLFWHAGPVLRQELHAFHRHFGNKFKFKYEAKNLHHFPNKKTVRARISHAIFIYTNGQRLHNIVAPPTTAEQHASLFHRYEHIVHVLHVETTWLIIFPNLLFISQVTDMSFDFPRGAGTHIH